MSLLGPTAALAQTDTIDFQITWDRRGAITDSSSAAGNQMRIWAHTVGDFVATARVDDTTAKWAVLAVGVHGGIDGVSWTEGAVPRQRTFFPQGDQLRWYNLDDDVPTASGFLPATPNLDESTGPTSPR